MGGLAVVLAIALAVVITVLVVRPSGGSSPTPTPTASEFASEGDVGPVNIITEDPTCAPWGKVVDRLADQENGVGWGDRDSSAPASAWTPEQRSMYGVVVNAMKDAAEQTVLLSKQTTHRVVRELYGQFGAYVRQFESSITSFTTQDAYIPEVIDRIASVMVNICASINYNSAAAQAPFLPKGTSPSDVAPFDESATEPRFLSDMNPVCTEWSDAFVKFDSDTADWRAISSDVPASQWTPQERALNENAAVTMTKYADDLQRLGADSRNAVLQDFAELAALYRRAYAHALSTYTPTDNYLGNTSTNLVRVVNAACKALP